jgi:hypothetical protein
MPSSLVGARLHHQSTVTLGFGACCYKTQIPCGNQHEIGNECSKSRELLGGLRQTCAVRGSSRVHQGTRRSIRFWPLSWLWVTLHTHMRAYLHPEVTRQYSSPREVTEAAGLTFFIPVLLSRSPTTSPLPPGFGSLSPPHEVSTVLRLSIYSLP